MCEHNFRYGFKEQYTELGDTVYKTRYASICRICGLVLFTPEHIATPTPTVSDCCGTLSIEDRMAICDIVNQRITTELTFHNEAFHSEPPPAPKQEKSCFDCPKPMSNCPHCKSDDIEKMRTEYRCGKCNKKWFYEIQAKQPKPPEGVEDSVMEIIKLHIETKSTNSWEEGKLAKELWAFIEGLVPEETDNPVYTGGYKQGWNECCRFIKQNIAKARGR